MIQRFSRSIVITIVLYLVFIGLVIPIFRARMIEQPSVTVGHSVAGAGTPLLCLSFPFLIRVKFSQLKMRLSYWGGR